MDKCCPICFGVGWSVRRRNHTLKREPPYLGGFFVVSIGGTSPSSQSCSLAKANHASSIRLYRKCSDWIVALSASREQFSAYSRKTSDCFIGSSCARDIGGKEVFTTERLMTLSPRLRMSVQVACNFR